MPCLGCDARPRVRARSGALGASAAPPYNRIARDVIDAILRKIPGGYGDFAASVVDTVYGLDPALVGDNFGTTKLTIAATGITPKITIPLGMDPRPDFVEQAYNDYWGSPIDPAMSAAIVRDIDPLIAAKSIWNVLTQPKYAPGMPPPPPAGTAVGALPNAQIVAVYRDAFGHPPTGDRLNEFRAVTAQGYNTPALLLRAMHNPKYRTTDGPFVGSMAVVSGWNTAAGLAYNQQIAAGAGSSSTGSSGGSGGSGGGLVVTNRKVYVYTGGDTSSGTSSSSPPPSPAPGDTTAPPVIAPAAPSSSLPLLLLAGAAVLLLAFSGEKRGAVAGLPLHRRARRRARRAR